MVLRKMVSEYRCLLDQSEKNHSRDLSHTETDSEHKQINQKTTGFQLKARWNDDMFKMFYFLKVSKPVKQSANEQLEGTPMERLISQVASRRFQIEAKNVSLHC